MVRVFALSALLLLVGAPRALAGATMQPPAPWRAKDFALVRHDGLYHLFYIRRNTTLPMDSSERDFGHAVSANLYQWRQLDPVLPVRPDAWDRDHVWAPSLVRHDGVWYLFYTGVVHALPDTNYVQRTGVATSTDLVRWNRWDAPVLTCAQVPWAACDPAAAPAFRDPFVLPDPAVAGRWLMAYSAQLPDSAGGGMVAALAASTDLGEWGDLGPLWITHHTRSWSTLVESPHLFDHEGLWYLVYTSNGPQPLVFATSPDPAAPESAWSHRGRLATMLGLDTSLWYASEHLRVGRLDYFAFVNGVHVEIHRMEWSGSSFSLAPPDPFHVVRMGWTGDSVAIDSTAVLRIESTWGLERTLALEWLAEEDDGTTVLLDPAPLALPATVEITGDTTLVIWRARLRTDTGDPLPFARYRARTVDHAAESGPLRVVARPAPPPPDDPEDRPRGWRGDGDDEPAGGELRPLGRSPLPGEHAFLVELARPAEARLELLDAAGRRVRALATREFGAGATVVSWDGRDDRGRRAPPGVYFVRLTTAAGARARRFVRLR